MRSSGSSTLKVGLCLLELLQRLWVVYIHGDEVALALASTTACNVDFSKLAEASTVLITLLYRSVLRW